MTDEQNDIIERTHMTRISPSLLEAPPPQESYCMLSPCQQYRYMLMHEWDKDLPLVNFIMLNPSTATETEDDPTMNRCIRRAKMWGYGGIIVTNLFAFRATDPKNLRSRGKNKQNPIEHAPGYNENAIATAAQACDSVICAWGTHGELMGRGDAVKNKIKMIFEETNPHGLPEEYHRRMWQLGVNSGGTPKHPLYLLTETLATRFE